MAYIVMLKHLRPQMEWFRDFFQMIKPLIKHRPIATLTPRPANWKARRPAAAETAMPP